jgi:hypothetical protein
MTSQINPNNIDGTYPVAGQDNSSQGFRDNFTNTKNNFTYAYDEITALQANAALRGQTNEFADSIIANVALRGQRDVVYDFGAVTGAQIYTFGNGSYQTMELAGSVVLSYAGFPTLTNRALKIRLRVFVPNTSFTLTWPAQVSQNLSSIANTTGQITSFTQTGVYEFELTTINSNATVGNITWSISEITRNRNTQQASLSITTVVANATATGISMTASNVGGVAVGNITATNFIGNIISIGNSISLTGNITANNITANTGFYGNIRTPIQSNITLVGTLTSLSVSGNANVGNITVTGLTDMCGGTAYGIQYEAAITNGGSTQLLSNVGFAILRSNGTIGTHTVIMPATPMSGQTIQLAFANITTTLTQAGSGTQTCNGAWTTANSSQGGTWIYHSVTDAWYRVG